MGFVEQHVQFHQLAAEQADTAKQSRFIEGVIEGKPGYLAAREAGYSAELSRTPYKLIPADEMRRKFQEVAERKGLTLDRVADKINQHLEAKANQTLNGKEVTVSDAPDNRVQQKAIEQLTTLLGMGESAKAAGGGSTVTLSISGPAADRLAAMLGGE
jgi:hypothetical protein